MKYRRRVVDAELDELMSELPAIALEGPRGVCKTATAWMRPWSTPDRGPIGAWTASP